MQLVYGYLFLAIVAAFIMMLRAEIEDNIDIGLCAVLGVFWLPILLAIVYVRKVK